MSGMGRVRETVEGVRHRVRQDVDWLIVRILRVAKRMSAVRFMFIVGPMLVGYVVTGLLGGDYPLSLAVTILFGSYAIVLLWELSFDTDDPKISVDELYISQDLRRVLLMSAFALTAAFLAEIRVAFAILWLMALFGVYAGRMMPEGGRYARFKQIPVVGEVLLGSMMGVLTVFSIFFYNQMAAGLEMSALLAVITAQFTIWYVIVEEPEDEDEEAELKEPEPPETVIGMYGEKRTTDAVRKLSAGTAVLFYGLVAIGYLHWIGVIAGLAYVAVYVALTYMSPENRDLRVRRVLLVQTYGFLVLAGIGWLLYHHVL